jgi:thiamine transport system substrate-binding protein
MKRFMLLFVVALLVAGCGSGGDDKAKSASDTVRLLTHDAFAASPEVLDEFTQQTGVRVEVVKAGDVGVLVNQAILRKDNPAGDLLFGIDNTFLTRAFDASLFDPYAPAAGRPSL